MAKQLSRARRGESRWRGILRAQGQSGQSIHAFCRAHRLGESTFYFWRRALASREETSARSRPKATARPAAFVPVRVAAVSVGSVGRMVILLPGGPRVRVTAPVDGKALAEVLAVLAKRSGEPEGREC